MYEHIIITDLEYGYKRLRPEEGYILYNDIAQRRFSEAVTKSIEGFRAVVNGVPPEPHQRTLDDAQKEKIAALKAYDSSPAVNTFYLNGNAMWIDYNLRNDYTLKVQSAQRQGLQTVSFLGQRIPVDTALNMLDAVNLYAMQCVDVTQTHENNIMVLTTISDVDNYDFTIGYPQKLSF